MAGICGKPVVEKLGIKPGFSIFCVGAPAAYADIVGRLPAGVAMSSFAKAPLDMVHLVVTEPKGMAGKLRDNRKAIAPRHDRGVLAEKILRRRDRAGRCRGARHRAAAWSRRYKVCAIDDTRSGLPRDQRIGPARKRAK
jgi:hypothetical protein